MGGGVAQGKPTVAALVLCGGSGTRFGSDKLQFEVAGVPLWCWSAEAFAEHPGVEHVIVVARPDLAPQVREAGFAVTEGGATRQQSVQNGLAALPKRVTHVLVHDGARPGVSSELIDRVLSALDTNAAVIPVLPIADTLRHRETHEVIPRDKLVSVQTPQAARLSDLMLAYQNPDPHATDDAALLKDIGIICYQVGGERDNMKVTNEEDGAVITRLLAVPESRTGLGYDIHAFSADPSRPLYLGGLLWPGEKGLEGHSDADVLLHAITDALLGAIVGGDIGQLFPNTDPAHKNAPSRRFVEEASRRVREAGWTVDHLDACMVAERPKIMVRSHEIREEVANMVGITADRVSLKATTHEGLGALGRGEGIAAWATASVSRWRPRRTST